MKKRHKAINDRTANKTIKIVGSPLIAVCNTTDINDMEIVVIKVLFTLGLASDNLAKSL